MIEAASKVNFSDARLEESVLHVIKTWGMTHPAELVSFDRQMKDLRKAQVRGGMSSKGNMRHFGDVPVTLAAMMTVKFGKDWAVDRKLIGHFFSHFRVGRVALGDRAPYCPSSARSEM